MDRINDLIANMPITVAELSRRSGVTVNTINSFTDGHMVRRDSAIKILNALSEVYNKQLTIQNVTGINYKGKK